MKGQNSTNVKERNPRIGIIGLKGLPAYGGSARAGENMISILKNSFDFTVYTVNSHTQRKTGYYDGYRQIVFKTFPIKALNTLFYFIKATFHALFAGSYDIIHVFHIDAAFIIPILRIRYKVVAGHRARPQEFSKWNKIVRSYFDMMEWVFYKIPADVITSVSKDIVNRYQSYTKKKIIYIPNGIVIESIEKYLEDRIERGDYILFASGRIIETKGCHYMLEALTKINYAGKIMVVGNLEHTPKYADHLFSFKKSLDIDFTGLVKNKDELMSIFRNSKFAIYPSMHEGMSNTLLELASMKTPVLCSDIPENTNVFNEKEVTFFKTNDASDLAEKIAWALENGDVMENKAKRAFDRIKKEYNWTNIADKYSKIYQQIDSIKR